MPMVRHAAGQEDFFMYQRLIEIHGVLDLSFQGKRSCSGLE